MYKAITRTLRVVALIALRVFLICAGAWLVALEPAESWANARRAANAASGHIPNMDPGVAVSLAQVLTAPIIFVLLVVEAVRWTWSGPALSLPSYFLLGLIAASPVGYSIAFGAPTSIKALYLASALVVAVFYSVRWAWIANRTRMPKVSKL